MDSMLAACWECLMVELSAASTGSSLDVTKAVSKAASLAAHLALLMADYLVDVMDLLMAA